VDTIQCSQQLNSGEISTIFSQLLPTNSGGVIIRLALIAPYILSVRMFQQIANLQTDCEDILM
jgi:hypothetical protein